MAFPITHIVFTEKVFNKLFSDKDLKKFIIGTSFPDIRYLGTIDREKTHFHDSGIEDVLRVESFLGGIKFHAIVDRVREDFIINNGFYDIAPPHENKWIIYTSIKYYEDLVYYSSSTRWAEYASFFDEILEEEIEFGVERQVVLKWHEMLKDYLKNFSTEESSIRTLMLRMGVKEELLSGLLEYANQLKTIPKVKSIIDRFYTDFEDLIE